MHLAVDQGGHTLVARWIADAQRLDCVTLIHIGVVARGIEQEWSIFIDVDAVIDGHRCVVDTGDSDVHSAAAAAAPSVNGGVGDGFFGCGTLGQRIKVADRRIGDLAGLVDCCGSFAARSHRRGAGAHRFALVGVGVVGSRVKAEGLVFAEADRVSGGQRFVVFTGDRDVDLGLGGQATFVLNGVGEGFRGGLPNREVVEPIGRRVGEGLAVIADGDQALVAGLARDAHDLERVGVVRIAVVGERIERARLVLAEGDLVGAGDRGVVHAGDRHIDPALIRAGAAVADHVVEAFQGGFASRQRIELADGAVGDLAFDIETGEPQVAGRIKDTNGSQRVRFRVGVVLNGVEAQRRVFAEGDAVGVSNRQLVGTGGQRGQQVGGRPDVDRLATGGGVGVEAKTQGPVAHIAIDPIGAADAQVLDKQNAATAVVDGRAEGVVADRAAVEGGVTAAALKNVVSPGAKDVGRPWPQAKGLSAWSSVENGAAAGDGNVGHRPGPKERERNVVAGLNLAALILCRTSEKRSA